MAGLGDYSKYATMGISWVLTTGVYLWLGYRGGVWLDARWQTEPIFLIVGILVGMIMSVMTLVKELLALSDAGVIRRGADAGNNNDRDSEKNNFPKGAGAVSKQDKPKGRNGRRL